MSSKIEDSSEPTFEWLTEELFEPIIEKELNVKKTEFTLKLLSVKPAVGKGENYVAQVTRVQVEVAMKNAINAKPKYYSYIIKSNVPQSEELNEWNVTEKEIVYYADILPKLIGINETLQFTPRCFFTSVELNKCIFLEDLSPLGYKMPNRYEGLDFEHCKLYFEKQAAYHALTAVCYERLGRFDERFHQSPYTEKTKHMHSVFIDLMYPVFFDIFRKYEHLKPFFDKIKKWEGKIFDTMQKQMEANYDEFNVLNHGDPWTNNLLYKYDKNNKPVGLSLIDHQLSTYGSPVQDILYFFLSSPNIEVRDKNFDNLLCVYHESLVANLKCHKYPKPIPTLSDLQMAILKKGSIGCLMVIGILAFVLIGTNETGPFDVILADNEEGEKIRYNFYNNPRYLSAVESCLKFLNNRGLLIE